MKFYVGTDVYGNRVICESGQVKELTANTTDAAQEKHVPVVNIEGEKVIVNVGSIDHPMTEEHSIQWIMLETERGSQTKALKPGEAPHAEFVLEAGDRAVAVYEYCNLHGLWKKEV